MSLDEDGNVYISANEGNLSVTFHGKLRSRIRGIFYFSVDCQGSFLEYCKLPNRDKK